MKKPSVVSFLITLLLAAAVCTQGQEPVKDTNNNPVEVNKRYIIQPFNGTNAVGGLLPFPIRSYPFCPLGISQGIIKNYTGIPISFKFPYETNETIVQTFFDVNIEFMSGDVLFCENFSKFWVVNETLSSPPILVGGDPQKENSWFQIEDGGAKTYKLTKRTGTVGISPAKSFNGQELVLSKDNARIMQVQFVKVSTPASTSTSQVEKFGLRMFPVY